MSDRPERAIRVLLADASRITTMGIRQVIEKESDIEIVGVASDGEEAVAKTNE
ncbi:MAG: response regulator transcription factor, partial [Chloroflexi bacterium]